MIAALKVLWKEEHILLLKLKLGLEIFLVSAH